ncbi:unnamed protein product [Cylicostephanus goldi]|uniref:Uncharacterized protein n=1 Tax=Cylicostephanus goldi TaxID=71465 RepID=A0A3P6R403_CYLGO|nr:unnamed protein product [Cylicostephanus goldi]
MGDPTATMGDSDCPLCVPLVEADALENNASLHDILELRWLNVGDVIQYAQKPFQRWRLFNNSSSLGVFPVKHPLPDVILCGPLLEGRHQTPEVRNAGFAQKANPGQA